MEEEGAHSNHSHDHNKYHPATEVTQKLLEKLAKGNCINITTTTKAHEEEPFHEILEAIHASSNVTMTYKDLNNLAMKITANKTCTNCIGVR